MLHIKKKYQLHSDLNVQQLEIIEKRKKKIITCILRFPARRKIRAKMLKTKKNPGRRKNIYSATFKIDASCFFVNCKHVERKTGVSS